MAKDAAADVNNALATFRWSPQPEADRLVHGLTTEFLERCPAAARLAERMLAEAGVRFADFLDHLVVAPSAELDRRLAATGFVQRQTVGEERCWAHPGGSFPRLVSGADGRIDAAIAVESVADFIAAHQLDIPIVGQPLAPYRRARISAGERADLWVVARHGYDGFAVVESDPALARRRLEVDERLRSRHREFPDPAAGFAAAERLIDEAIAALGRDLACDRFFAAEREYWQRRNRAGRQQKMRQDALGLGWANHDHHTYRSSRQWFPRLIGLLERLGFSARERFYPGKDAGWGAQVLDHPVTGVVIFADVDMSPDELQADFAHRPFAPRQRLGTVGLWCALHGEAMLEAGLHHLASKSDFQALRAQLAGAEGVVTMKPFSEYPYLEQAFTEGERWPVRRERIDGVLAAGQIDAKQAEQFAAQGAIGSHLENVERNQGFKGFNQHGVDEIIAGTDPRRAGGR